MSKKIAMASLSYDPATDREIYPGAIPIKAAASNPADGLAISVVNLVPPSAPMTMQSHADIVEVI
jgi:hypothetical protein